VISPGSTSEVRLATIGEIAEVLPGFSIVGPIEHDPHGTHQVVLSRHLTPGIPYRYRSADEMRIKPNRDAARYELQAGDVLFMSRGTRNVATVIAETPAPSIAPVSFYVLRSRAAVEPGYLAWFLGQPGAQRELAQIRTGAGTPLVQRTAFLELRVPLPDSATQRHLADLNEFMARERLLLDNLVTATARAHDATSDQIARGLLGRATHDAINDTLNTHD
jgi:hypothetical protein